MEDYLLAVRAATGDQEAFTALVKRYRRYIYTLAYKVVLNPEDALDITQNVFLRLTHTLTQFNSPGNFRAWLSTMTVRLAIDFKRKAVHREEPTEMNELAQISEERRSDPAENPRTVLEASQKRRKVETAMEELSVQQRAVFALHYLEDMQSNEIAVQLGISARQVRIQLHRAVAHIRQIVLDNGPDKFNEY